MANTNVAWEKLGAALASRKSHKKTKYPLQWRFHPDSPRKHTRHTHTYDAHHSANLLTCAQSKSVQIPRRKNSRRAVQYRVSGGRNAHSHTILSHCESARGYLPSGFRAAVHSQQVNTYGKHKCGLGNARSGSGLEEVTQKSKKIPS